MVKTLCDRCGVEIPNPKERFYIEFKNRLFQDRQLEVCEKCYKEIKDRVFMPEEGDNRAKRII